LLQRHMMTAMMSSKVPFPSEPFVMTMQVIAEIDDDQMIMTIF